MKKEFSSGNSILVQKPKILVGTPTFEGMKYCLDEFLEGIGNIDYENYDFLIVDNSKNDNFFQELSQKEGIILIRDNNDEEKNLKRILHSRNKIIDYALKHNYEYILLIDADIIPPKTIISELLSCKKPLVSGIYNNYFKYSKKMVWLPLAFVNLSEEEFEDLKKNYRTSAESRFKLKRHLSEEEIATGKLFEVLYCAGGCMLIKREVFEKCKYEFREKYSDEIIFMENVSKAGFKLYCKTSIKCKHLVDGKYIRDKEGNLLNPTAL